LKQIFIDYLGILWVLLFSSLTLIALVLHSSYNPLVDAVSELGAGEGAIYFNTGMIIAGLLGSILAFERYKKFNKILTIIGIFTMISLAFVGIFPINNNLHGFFTGLMFCSTGIFFILYGILTRSHYIILMLIVNIVFIFISVSLAEWIIFMTVNVWMIITSTKFYYQKRKIYNKFVNI